MAVTDILDILSRINLQALQLVLDWIWIRWYSTALSDERIRIVYLVPFLPEDGNISIHRKVCIFLTWKYGQYTKKQPRLLIASVTQEIHRFEQANLDLRLTTEELQKY